MQRKFSYPVLLTVAVCLSVLSASAKVWRVNNNGGVSANFATFTAAVTSSNVSNGDTLYLEGSATPYNGTLSKKLVIIGSGYYLSGASSNPGLQANSSNSSFNNLIIDSAGSGSTLIGIEAYLRIYPGTDNITLTRSSIYLDAYNDFGYQMDNLTINKCVLGIAIANTARMNNLTITNCILNRNFNVSGAISGLIRNNVILGALTAANCYFSNNIFSGTTSLSTATNCVFKYNISVYNNVLPAGNNNQNNVPEANIFVGTGSSDGKYQLKAGSPALGAGEPVNGITPDCGIFGTADPYKLSGIPSIPTIYSLTAPTSVPSSATSMTVTISTRSNN